jgi:hypothetical protein
VLFKWFGIELVPQNLEILKRIGAVGIIGGDFLENYKIDINPYDQN